MKKQCRLFVITFIIVISILMIFLAIFKIFNEGEKKISDKGVDVYLSFSTLYVQCGKKQYTIEPDKQTVTKIINYVFEHPIVLPPPFSFSLFSNGVVEGVWNLFNM